MRVGDVILITLMIGAIFTVFLGMVTDNEMHDHYEKYEPSLNLSGRETAMRANNTAYYMLEEAITGQTAESVNVTSLQEDLEQASKNDIGILSVPGAVLKALKTVFTVFRFKWFNTMVSGIEHMFGLDPGALGLLTIIGKIILWVLIFLFVGAILRWIV